MPFNQCVSNGYGKHWLSRSAAVGSAGLAQEGSSEDDLDAELARIQRTLADTSTAVLLDPFPKLRPPHEGGIATPLDVGYFRAAASSPMQPHASHASHAAVDPPVATIGHHVPGDRKPSLQEAQRTPQGQPQPHLKGEALEASQGRDDSPGEYLQDVMKYFLTMFVALGDSMMCACHELKEVVRALCPLSHACMACVWCHQLLNVVTGVGVNGGG